MDIVRTGPQLLPSPNKLTRSILFAGLTLGATQCPLPHCASPPVDMCTPLLPSECDQCVTECNIEDCDLNTEEQCTDHCVVVPCNDPCLDSCGTCTTPLTGQFKGEPGQYHGFEDFLKSCSDLSYLEPSYPNFITQPSFTQDHHQASFPDWNNTSLSRELDALLCACTTQTLPHEFDCNSCDPNLLVVNRFRCNPQLQYHQHQSPSISAPASAQRSGRCSAVSALISPKPTPSLSSCSTPNSSPAVATSPRPSPSMATSELSNPPELLRCRWASCERAFGTPQELAAHVNIAHLHLPPPREGVQMPRPHENTPLQDPNWISCLWDNCNLFPTPSQVPGPSVGNVFEAAKGFLACHVQQDHLGLPASHQLTYSTPYKPVPDELQDLFPDISSHASASASTSNLSAHCRSSPSPLNTPQNNESCTTTGFIPSQHFCRWQPCTQVGVSFGSVADLTAHITDVHVGVGNSRYHCMWEGCNRNGDLGFASKQKILRHIQSHTGYRPFKCEVCDQFFSEAATLQQHMRRHTKEKPYVCDFPGCNKAFAITGALTIHRRVHSGNKPFKCPHCSRSFSESSNLSKHVRTHTGVRPYPCPFPGCDKRFARPDQVARHRNVHAKKKNADNKTASGSKEGMEVD